MNRLILYNWLILAIASLLVAIYISIFEHFVHDKAYLFLILTLVFSIVYYRRKKKQ